jgi:hypothetical protein
MAHSIERKVVREADSVFERNFDKHELRHARCFVENLARMLNVLDYMA